MSDKKILERAINKAIAGGWDMPNHFYLAGNRVYFVMSGLSEHVLSYFDVIFNHEFCKALWGEEAYYYPTQEELNEKYNGAISGKMYAITNAGWKDHIQRMVVADDPIKYLGEHLDD